MIDLIGQLESPAITVHQERCVLVRNRNAKCLRCAEVCTTGCINYDGEHVVISPASCIGCATCATACPTCALEAHHPDDNELLRQCAMAASAAEGSVCLACSQLLERAQGRYDVEKVVQVRCLGRVEESLVVSLAARGVQEIVLVGGNCEQCAHVSGWKMAQQVCDTARQLLQTWGASTQVRITRKLPTAMRAHGTAFDKRRRAAFERSGREVARTGAAIASVAAQDAFGTPLKVEGTRKLLKVMEDGTLPHFIPDRRERLLDALASLGEPRDVMLDTRLWGHVIIDQDTCSSCQMCATFCPTGAIAKFHDDDGAFGVEHYPGDCVKCRCCATICPEGALELSEEVFAVDMLAGMVDRYEMQPPKVERGKPHTIWHTMQGMTNTDQVYER